MAEGYLYLIVPLGLGYWYARYDFLPKYAQRVLNFFVINIALPATVLISINKMSLSYDLLIPAAAQWFALLVGAGLVLTAARYLKFSRLVTGTMLLVVPLGNTAFLGLSVIPVFFGGRGIPYGVMYDQLGSFLALATYGAAIAGRYGNSGRTDVISLLKKIVTFPPFIFLIIGIVIPGEALPGWSIDILSFIAKGLVPAAMFAIGMNITLKYDKELIRPLETAVGVKLLIVPVILLLIFTIIGRTGIASQISVFQAAMPSMITAAVLASDKGLDKRLATMIVSVGLVLSLLTLPLIYYLIEMIKTAI